MVPNDITIHPIMTLYDDDDNLYMIGAVCISVCDEKVTSEKFTYFSSANIFYAIHD